MKKARIFLDEVACSTLNYFLFGIVLLVGSSRRLIPPVVLIYYYYYYFLYPTREWGKEWRGGGGERNDEMK